MYSALPLHNLLVMLLSAEEVQCTFKKNSAKFHRSSLFSPSKARILPWLAGMTQLYLLRSVLYHSGYMWRLENSFSVFTILRVYFLIHKIQNLFQSRLSLLLVVVCWSFSLGANSERSSNKKLSCSVISPASQPETEQKSSI